MTCFCTSFSAALQLLALYTPIWQDATSVIAEVDTSAHTHALPAWHLAHMAWRWGSLRGSGCCCCNAGVKLNTRALSAWHPAHMAWRWGSLRGSSCCCCSAAFSACCGVSAVARGSCGLQGLLD